MITTLKKQSRTVLLLLIPFLIVIFLFSVFIYFSVSNYSEKNFFKLLEARAYKVAKERLDEKITKSDPNSPEKLPHEKDFFIPIDNTLNIKEQVQKIADSLGLVYVEEGAETVVTYAEVNAAQQAWCDALVKIGKIKEEGGDYTAFANEVLSSAYNYDSGKVFFKPTLAFGDG